jgi:hypothetical protein
MQRAFAVRFLQQQWRGLVLLPHLSADAIDLGLDAVISPVGWAYLRSCN